MDVKIFVANDAVAQSLKDNDVVIFQSGDKNGPYCRVYSDKDNIIEKFNTSSEFEKQNNSIFKSCFHCDGNIEEAQRKLKNLFSQA